MLAVVEKSELLSNRRVSGVDQAAEERATLESQSGRRVAAMPFPTTPDIVICPCKYLGHARCKDSPYICMQMRIIENDEYAVEERNSSSTL